jgi:hypothetical protein
MSRWLRTLAPLTALLPQLVLADVASPPSATARKGSSSPYQEGGAPHSRQQEPHAPTAMAPRLRRALPAEPRPPAPREEEGAALGRAQVCKVFDRNANGAADAGEPLVADWRFRLTDGQRGSTVRTTGEDGCATFTRLRPGSYALSEDPPSSWQSLASATQRIDVLDPRARGGGAATTAVAVGSCVQFARLGSTEYWRGRSGLLLMDDGDQRFVNSLDPFRSPSGSFAAGDEPFDGLFADGVAPVRGAFDGSAAWGPGTWQAELSLYLGDRGVSADPRGRLAQEILAFALNTRHFLERASVVYLEDTPIYVDDLIFEGIASWRSDNPAWRRSMTALLAALNGSSALPYVPRDSCLVAYLPF